MSVCECVGTSVCIVPRSHILKEKECFYSWSERKSKASFGFNRNAFTCHYTNATYRGLLFLVRLLKGSVSKLCFGLKWWTINYWKNCNSNSSWTSLGDRESCVLPGCCSWTLPPNSRPPGRETEWDFALSEMSAACRTHGHLCRHPFVTTMWLLSVAEVAGFCFLSFQWINQTLFFLK